MCIFNTERVLCGIALVRPAVATERSHHPLQQAPAEGEIPDKLVPAHCRPADPLAVAVQRGARLLKPEQQRIVGHLGSSTE